MSQHEITLTVNGEWRTARAPARLTLVDFLRDELGLTGSHIGCLMFAVQATGCDVVTVEGLAPDAAAMSVLQDSFCEEHALQCGFCTPGMLLSAHALLQRNPRPSEADIREAIGGNLCRCTGYKQIVDAVALAARRLSVANAPVEGRTERL